MAAGIPGRALCAGGQFCVGLDARFVPFVLLGAGALHAKSTEMGSDTDFLLDFGIGAKYFATKHVVPRLDMTQREGGGLSNGVALHGEIMLGVSVNFGVH